MEKDWTKEPILLSNLQEANFMYAEITRAKNLTIEQLSKVKTLYKAKLEPELLEQVKKCCPNLLEKPKEEAAQKEETDLSSINSKSNRNE
jgi:hypothetical protein